MSDTALAIRSKETKPEFAVNAGAVNLGVVQHPNRDPHRVGECCLRVEAFPLGNEFRIDPGARTGAGDVVRGSDDHAVSDHAGHPDGCPVGLRQLLRQLGESLHEQRRGKWVRRRDPNRLGAHRPGLVEHRGLDATTTAVDSKRGCHGRKCAR